MMTLRFEYVARELEYLKKQLIGMEFGGRKVAGIEAAFLTDDGYATIAIMTKAGMTLYCHLRRNFTCGHVDGYKWIITQKHGDKVPKAECMISQMVKSIGAVSLKGLPQSERADDRSVSGLPRSVPSQSCSL